MNDSGLTKHNSRKKIVVCSDGTWNRPGMTDRGRTVESNVQIIYRCVSGNPDHEPRQVKAYHSGVGSSSFSVSDKLMGGMAGAGIDRNIKDLYTFILMSYRPGDEIYLFGFSRGAYTVRSLAGLIRNSGILRPEHMVLVDKAYELYRDRNAFTSPDSDLMKSFKAAYCQEPVTRIHFLGVWDTVGSLGIPLPALRMNNKERYQFHDVKLSSTIDNAYHALAVHERRKMFLPTLWETSDSIPDPAAPVQRVEQRWFSGVHCNVGGGYVDKGLSDLALMWMIEKARGTGLVFDEDCDDYRAIHGNPAGVLRNSYTPMYWMWGPVWRPVMANAQANEVIDDSVRERYKYVNFRNVPPNLRGKI